MYNYLMSASEWKPGRGTMPIGRFYAEQDERFKTVNGVISPALLALPALLMPEVNPREANQTARVATLHSAKIAGSGDIIIDYTIDPDIPPLPVSWLVEHTTELAIPTGGFMLAHVHWNVNDADLFRTILKIGLPKPPEPTVFKIDHTLRDKDTISVMMPFDSGFTPVYEAIKAAAEPLRFKCYRADDLWLHHHVMQSIVSLICKSAIVIADCSTRNPNVFYEAGIAHSLGRDVILIAQRIEDVPFDLRHIYIITYLPNAQGLTELTAKLKDRINDVAATQKW